MAVFLVAMCSLASPPARSADEFGIFETIHESSVSFSETVDAVESALQSSMLLLHAAHDVRLPDATHEARIYVLTSPAFVAAASAESPRTVSAQALRIAVFTLGAEKKTFVNMANPVAHAMVFYADSPNYDALISAAGAAADELRQLVAPIPGRPVRVPMKPLRTEKHYNKFKGDGPARVMAKFRTWDKSQLLIEEDAAENFDAVVARVSQGLGRSTVADASEAKGWDVVAKINIRNDAVYIGLSNPFIEDRMVRINSRFRSDNKTDAAPYPGVDHMAALRTDVLIVKEDGKTLVLHYGQMWRMQLYFWDSGYRAFTANMGVPGAISESIEAAIAGAGN
jgi:hypothetical protein